MLFFEKVWPFLGIVFLISACDAFTGPPGKKYFDKTLGFDGEDFAQAIVQSKDGQFFLAGYTNSIRHNYDFYLLKIDQEFNLIWSKTIGSSFLDRCEELVATDDNGMAAVGTVFLKGDNSDALVVRLDKNGQLLWSKNFGDNGKDEGRSIVRVANGFVIAYTVSVPPSYNTDIFITHLDQTGNTVWTKPLSSALREKVRKILVTPDGGFLVAGYRVDTNNNWNVLLIKLNASGDPIWEMTYDNRNQDEPYSVIQSQDGGFVVTSRSYIPDPGGDTGIWVFKINSSGNMVWSNLLGSSYIDQGFGIAEVTDGFIIVGSMLVHGLNAQLYVAKIGIDGNLLWEKLYGKQGDDVATGCLALDDGSIIVTGYTQARGNSDIYMMKLDAEGNLE
ncbi:hypothetical protein K1X84_02420 [bacterium]|nr:hypothetical protein [bacterium]